MKTPSTSVVWTLFWSTPAAGTHLLVFASREAMLDQMVELLIRDTAPNGAFLSGQEIFNTLRVRGRAGLKHALLIRQAFFDKPGDVILWKRQRVRCKAAPVV